MSGLELTSLLKLPWTLLTTPVRWIWESVTRRAAYNALNVPRQAVAIMPHQELRPFWSIGEENEMYLRCDWYVTNVTSADIAMVGTYLATPRSHGSLQTWHVPVGGDTLFVNTITPNKVAEVSTCFWVKPCCERGKPYKSDVELIDQYGNVYRRKGVVFQYQILGQSSSKISST